MTLEPLASLPHGSMVSLPPSQSNRQPFLDQANAIRATNPIDRLPTTQDIFAAAVYEHLWMKDGFEHLTGKLLSLEHA